MTKTELSPFVTFVVETDEAQPNDLLPPVSDDVGIAVSEAADLQMCLDRKPSRVAGLGDRRWPTELYVPRRSTNFRVYVKVVSLSRDWMKPD